MDFFHEAEDFALLDEDAGNEFARRAVFKCVGAGGVFVVEIEERPVDGIPGGLLGGLNLPLVGGGGFEFGELSLELGLLRSVLAVTAQFV